MLLILFYFFVIGYAALCGYMYLNQRRLMYLPDTHIEAPEHYGLSGFWDIDLNEGKNHILQLWYRKAQAGFPTIVYYHGNASHIGGRAGLFGALADKGFGVAAVSYRGYGHSVGSPTELGLYEDARSALAFVMGKEQIPLSKIIVYGESLGTGVAVQMASEYAVGGLILQAPYTSIAKRAAEIYPFIPVRFLIRDHYDSINKIAQVKAPLLLYHGEKDIVIPVGNGRALLAAASEPKQGLFFPDNAHNDFDSAVISSHVLTFARNQHLIENA